MNFLGASEVPLRSYIQTRITLLENALEEEVRNRDNVDIALLEEQFDRESEYFIAGITRRVQQIRDEIKSYRPTDVQAPDYDKQMVQYRQFLHSSSISLNRMTDSIDYMFDTVKSLVKSVIEWMVDNARTIVDILEQICQAFRFVESFFHR